MKLVANTPCNTDVKDMAHGPHGPTPCSFNPVTEAILSLFTLYLFILYFLTNT